MHHLSATETNILRSLRDEPMRYVLFINHGVTRTAVLFGDPSEEFGGTAGSPELRASAEQLTNLGLLRQRGTSRTYVLSQEGQEYASTI